MEDRYSDKNKVRKLVFELLSSALSGSELCSSVKEELDTSAISSIYFLAKKHDLAHVISYVLYKNGITPESEIALKLKKAETIAFFRNERLKFVFDQICKLFDENGIAYIPLKGSVLRPYYPTDNMRTSCDIDILIHEEDLDRALKLLEASDYKIGNRNYHDVSVYSNTNVHLELHFNIQENQDNLDAVLKDAWSYAKLTEGNRYEFSEEFFIFHMYAHMSYHFLSGGCGIRSLMDIWIMENKMGFSYSVAEELLKKAGIYQFAKEMSDLAETLFSSKDPDEFSRELIGYIFSGGVYGSTENHAAVGKTKNKSSAGYFLKRIFLPYKTMAWQYPILKKAPFLLPFCWVARCVKAIFNRKTKKFLNEMSMVNNISEEKLESVNYIRARLGL